MVTHRWRVKDVRELTLQTQTKIVGMLILILDKINFRRRYVISDQQRDMVGLKELIHLKDIGNLNIEKSQMNSAYFIILVKICQ